MENGEKEKVELNSQGEVPALRFAAYLKTPDTEDWTTSKYDSKFLCERARTNLGCTRREL